MPFRRDAYLPRSTLPLRRPLAATAGGTVSALALRFGATALAAYPLGSVFRSAPWLILRPARRPAFPPGLWPLLLPRVVRQVQSQYLAADEDPLQVPIDLLGHAVGQVDQTVVVADVDTADIAALQTRLVGDGTNDLPRGDPVVAAHLDAVVHHADLVVVLGVSRRSSRAVPIAAAVSRQALAVRRALGLDICPFPPAGTPRARQALVTGGTGLADVVLGPRPGALAGVAVASPSGLAAACVAPPF